MFYFCNLENHLSIMKNVFNSISIYSWKKIPLSTNIRYKCVTRKIIFLILWKMAKWNFPSKTFHFQYDNRFLFSREMEMVFRIVFALAFFKLLKIEESFGKNFSFQFFAKCLNKSIKYFFKKFLKILIFYFGISLYHKV